MTKKLISKILKLLKFSQEAKMDLEQLKKGKSGENSWP